MRLLNLANFGDHEFDSFESHPTIDNGRNYVSLQMLNNLGNTPIYYLCQEILITRLSHKINSLIISIAVL